MLRKVFEIFLDLKSPISERKQREQNGVFPLRAAYWLIGLLQTTVGLGQSLSNPYPKIGSILFTNAYQISMNSSARWQFSQILHEAQQVDALD
jgi:hypothetical protein